MQVLVRLRKFFVSFVENNGESGFVSPASYVNRKCALLQTDDASVVNGGSTNYFSRLNAKNFSSSTRRVDRRIICYFIFILGCDYFTVCM